jgi:hypothetical protein
MSWRWVFYFQKSKKTRNKVDSEPKQSWVIAICWLLKKATVSEFDLHFFIKKWFRWNVGWQLTNSQNWSNSTQEKRRSHCNWPTTPSAVFLLFLKLTERNTNIALSSLPYVFLLRMKFWAYETDLTRDVCGNKGNRRINSNSEILATM